MISPLVWIWASLCSFSSIPLFYYEGPHNNESCTLSNAMCASHLKIFVNYIRYAWSECFWMCGLIEWTWGGRSQSLPHGNYVTIVDRNARLHNCTRCNLTKHSTICSRHVKSKGNTQPRSILQVTSNLDDKVTYLWIQCHLIVHKAPNNLQIEQQSRGYDASVAVLWICETTKGTISFIISIKVS